MRSHDKVQSSIEDVRDDERAREDPVHPHEPSQLHIVPGKTSKPRHRFPEGNRLGGRRRRQAPEDPIEALTLIVMETLARLRKREYVVDGLPDGKGRRREKRLDAASANAVANLVRVRLDLIAQYEAGEEVRRLQGEIEQLKAVTFDLLQR